jgi:hypothetical protein
LCGVCAAVCAPLPTVTMPKLSVTVLAMVSSTPMIR